MKKYEPYQKNILDSKFIHGFLNSKVASVLLMALSPTLDFNGGVFAKLPVVNTTENIKIKINQLVTIAVNASKLDWDSLEQSWDFKKPCLLQISSKNSLQNDWTNSEIFCNKAVKITVRTFFYAEWPMDVDRYRFFYFTHL